MSRRPSSPVHSATRHLRGAALLAAAALALGSPLFAGPPSCRDSLPRRLALALFPKSNPGYVPVVGSPALRIEEVPPPAPIAPPPVALYAPPPPPSPQPAQPEVAATAASAQQPQATAPATAATPSPIRPEDFLPFFQLDDGTAHRAPAEGLQFTPARPSMPTSRAEYRQQ